MSRGPLTAVVDALAAMGRLSADEVTVICNEANARRRSPALSELTYFDHLGKPLTVYERDVRHPGPGKCLCVKCKADEVLKRLTTLEGRTNALSKNLITDERRLTELEERAAADRDLLRDYLGRWLAR